jgi:hypothetical protein
MNMLFTNYSKGMCELQDLFIPSEGFNNSCLVAENFIINSKGQLEPRSGSILVDNDIGPNAKFIFYNNGFLALRYQENGIDYIVVYEEDLEVYRFELIDCENFVFTGGFYNISSRNNVLWGSNTITGPFVNSDIDFIKYKFLFFYKQINDNATSGQIIYGDGNTSIYNLYVGLVNHNSCNVGFIDPPNLVSFDKKYYWGLNYSDALKDIDVLSSCIYANQLILLSNKSIFIFSSFSIDTSTTGFFIYSLIKEDDYQNLESVNDGFVIYGFSNVYYFHTSTLNESKFTPTNIRSTKLANDGCEFLSSWQNLVCYNSYKNEKIYMSILGKDSKIVYNIPSTEESEIVNIKFLDDSPARILICRKNGMVDVLNVLTQGDGYSYSTDLMGLTRWIFYQPCLNIYTALGRKVYVNINGDLQFIDLNKETYLDGQGSNNPETYRAVETDLIVQDPNSTTEPLYSGFDIYYKFVSRDMKFSIGGRYGIPIDNIVGPMFYGFFMGDNFQSFYIELEGSRAIAYPDGVPSGGLNSNSGNINQDELVRHYKLKKFPSYELFLDGLNIRVYGLISIDPFTLSGCLINYLG